MICKKIPSDKQLSKCGLRIKLHVPQNDTTELRSRRSLRLSDPAKFLSHTTFEACWQISIYIIIHIYSSLGYMYIYTYDHIYMCIYIYTYTYIHIYIYNHIQSYTYISHEIHLSPWVPGPKQFAGPSGPVPWFLWRRSEATISDFRVANRGSKSTVYGTRCHKFINDDGDIDGNGYR